MGKTIMWFRNDLRFDDNTAFLEMLRNADDKDSYLCLFQLNPKQFLENSFNHNAFFKSVATFSAEADKKKIKLHFLYGDPEESFESLKSVCSEWDTVYFNEAQRGFGKKRDEQINKFFQKNHIAVHSYQDSHLHGVEEITKPDGANYQVFTPYFKKWQTKKKPAYRKTEKIELKFEVLKHPLFEKGQQEFDNLLQQCVLPFDHTCGEKNAEKQLKRFIKNNLHSYEKNRDFPAVDKTSRLSNYLRTGELSIRKVWQAVQAEPDSDGKQAFISELCWRDFYNMIYANYPKQKEESIKEKYRTLMWSQNKHHFELWKHGETGYPIVDAAMKQLNQTGWMHNRLRMIVASFLTKDLLIDWRWGERYFEEKLIDYDPASNSGGWQWAASTGTDAVPYFRIFNPVTQGQRFDKNGEFIRQFLPHLRKVKNKHIHEPYNMSVEEQQESECTIGKDYPEPIVNHQKIRAKTLSFFKENE